jgi:hypothetical protein
MIQFADSNEKQWSFKGVSSRVERIRDLTGFDFGLLHEESGISQFQELLEDRERCLKLIRAAVEEQAEANAMSADDWDEAWPTELMLPTMVEFGKEAARFFSPLRSKAIIFSLDRLLKAYRKVMEDMGRTISNVEVPPIDAASLVESSESTPAS